MACCPSNSDVANVIRVPPVAAKATSTPAWPSDFTEIPIQTKLKDGYWIEAFPFRATPCPDEGPVGPEIIAYGLGVSNEDSEIRMYLNPYHKIENQIKLGNEWTPTVIQKLKFPVSVTYGHFRRNSSFNDVIICHDYGPSMDKLNEEGGIVSYLKNPGDRTQGMWEPAEIGRFAGMHRLKIKSGDRETPAPIIIYTPSKWDEPGGTPISWESCRPLDGVFRLIHDAEVIHSTTTGELDKVLFAGREGISLMWKEKNSGRWRYENIGTGIPQTRIPFNNPYWGSGSVATGRVGTDSVGYIASCEAFHGNLVSVYVKPRGTRPDNIVAQEHWRRFVIDDFGPLKPKEFTGTIHHVQCADLDGDGIDSIIVACIGYPKTNPINQGTYVYKPVDLSRGRFTRSKISNGSAGRIAIADYRCSGTLDVATITYSVPGYHEEPEEKERQVRMMLNNTRQTRSVIKAEKLGDEVKLLVPRADTADHISETPFLDIGGKILSLVVLPPHKEYLLGEKFYYQDREYEKDGVKVINGKLSWTNSNGECVTRGIAVEPQKSASMLPDAPNHIVKAGDKGAIFVRLQSSTATTLPGRRYNNMDDVATINCLPFTADPAARDLLFPWVAVKDRPWVKPPGNFNWPFYNQVGYHILYNDDSFDRLCHIQAWTLVNGQTAGFHNHEDRSFCEIHACLSNGNHPDKSGARLGGMRWAKDEEADKFLKKNPNERDPAILDQHTHRLPVDDMEEHGPLWHIDANGRPKLRETGAVYYPQHAWLAGPKQDEENYDVWLAFEFPATEFQEGLSKAHGCAAC
ncbi:hypothetical protein FRC12_006597 [Ceratobasidium sp. 428]|nr:hypothetical protein FRC12_006597 [Ceratobasidium sp. 428]